MAGRLSEAAQLKCLKVLSPTRTKPLYFTRREKNTLVDMSYRAKWAALSSRVFL